MRSQWKKSTMVIVGVAAILCCGTLLVGTAFAPASGDIHIQAVAHELEADAGRKGEAAIVVGLYTSTGPLKGLLTGNFRVADHAVPPGGCGVEKKRVDELENGVYRIIVAPPPENPAAVWERGRYVISVRVSCADGPAVAIVELLVDVDG